MVLSHADVYLRFKYFEINSNWWCETKREISIERKKAACLYLFDAMTFHLTLSSPIDFVTYKLIKETKRAKNLLNIK